MSRDESFLGRWSRRKTAARSGEEAVGPESSRAVTPAPVSPAASHAMVVPPATVVASQPTAPSVESRSEPPAVPDLESLRGLQSDYEAFMQPEVGEGTRRAALKKLFADPHFNQMDGLDVYIDDYGKFEPMSAAVAASLAANKYLRVTSHLASEQAMDSNAAPAAWDSKGAAVAMDEAVPGEALPFDETAQGEALAFDGSSPGEASSATPTNFSGPADPIGLPDPESRTA